MLLRRALTVLSLVLLVVPAGAAERPAEQGEHDFRDAIVVFTLEYEDDLLPAPPLALGEARIRRLGNVFFLTGIQPEELTAPQGGEPPTARRHWIPLSDIVRLAEYDDVESALRALELDEAGDDGDRPVVRRVSREGGRGERSPRRKRIGN